MHCDVRDTVSARFSDLFTLYEGLRPSQVEGIITTFEQTLGRKAERLEIRHVLNLCEEKVKDAEAVYQMARGEAILFPRWSAPHYVGGDWTESQAQTLSLNDYEAAFVGAARQTYEATRHLMVLDA